MAGCPGPEPENPVGGQEVPPCVGRDFHVAAIEPKQSVPMGTGTSALTPALSPKERENYRPTHHNNNGIPQSDGGDTPVRALSAPEWLLADERFNQLALELFVRQFEANPVYQAWCHARGRNLGSVEHWTQIPAVPTVAFKELELSSIPAAERSVVFHSSGTTEQKPSRHFHSAASLAVYEASLTHWFNHHLGAAGPLHFLTPSRQAAPHSSLIYMFETLRQQRSLPPSAFLGNLAGDGSWALDFPAVLAELQSASATGRPMTLLGTAFSFVHLLDYLAEHQLRFRLPPGSHVMETGGYKNRSRTLPKAELHALINEKLGIPASHILCEYGMSELSSQAYDNVTGDACQVTRKDSGESCHPSPVTRHFSLPPWARVQVISPETGKPVGDGETGLLRIFDLANAFSVMALQTEDLAVSHGGQFELLGRAQAAEPRGCSLMTA